MMSNLPAGLVVMTAVMVPPGSKTCRRDERSAERSELPLGSEHDSVAG